MSSVTRVAALGLLIACSSRAGAPVPAPTGVQGDNTLAVVHPARAVLDLEHGHVLVHRARGIDVLELASGKSVAHLDLGWDGEAWPAARYLLAFHSPGALAIEATLIDPIAVRRVATCSRSVKAPAGAQLMRVDVFTARGTMYLKWETAPSSEPRGGRAMSEDEIVASQRRFDAAYACGLLSVRVASGGCSLEPSTFREAGLESCETRTMPGQRVMPPVVGDLRLQVEDGLHPVPNQGGVMTEIEILIVSGSDGAERWRTEIGHQTIVPPAP